MKVVCIYLSLFFNGTQAAINHFYIESYHGQEGHLSCKKIFPRHRGISISIASSLPYVSNITYADIGRHKSVGDEVGMNRDFLVLYAMSCLFAAARRLYTYKFLQGKTKKVRKQLLEAKLIRGNQARGAYFSNHRPYYCPPAIYLFRQYCVCRRVLYHQHAVGSADMSAFLMPPSNMSKE